jgi:type I restriction-modification system DNA methylase subunit
MDQEGGRGMSTFRNELIKLLQRISDRRSPFEAFEALIRLSACAVAMQTREEEYEAEAKRWDADSMQLFKEGFAFLVESMEQEPYSDILGPVYMELGSSSGQKWNGEFYTPPSICKLMAGMTLQTVVIPPDRPLELLEPACGAGGMVLSAAEMLIDQGYSPLNMQVTCIDISRLACEMAYLNLTLWNIPATIIHGNTLSLETWGGWRNMWWPLARGSALSPFESKILKLLKGDETLTPAAVPVSEQREIVTIVQKGSQFAMDFGDLCEVAK